MAGALDIPESFREAISARIGDDKSPVGIDAKETHVLILHKLIQLEERLAAIEQRLASLND